MPYCIIIWLLLRHFKGKITKCKISDYLIKRFKNLLPFKRLTEHDKICRIQQKICFV